MGARAALDAVGAGVHYGLPPQAAAAAPKAAAAAPQPPPTATTPGWTAPAKPRPAGHARSPAGACAGTPKGAGSSQDQWAMLRVAPQHEWPFSRGSGVMVAILDSGVDADVPELAGRVTAGDDIVAGTGRGNTDCLGSGTAMAGIVAARSSATGGAAGMAPAATVMPVRVAPARAAVSAADQASAIEVAVSAGAKVIALGSYIDPAQPAVASAIDATGSQGAVVVAAAPARSPGARAASGGAVTSPGMIWVGAIDINGAAAASYQPGAVDVVAPGVGVTGLGITGTGQFEGSGAQYAVAFAAGEAALVRARYPKLTAAQVVRRIEATADRMGSAASDATFGWGLIDPGVAVTRLIADEGRRPGPPGRVTPGHGWSSLRIRALLITIVLALVLVVVLALRIHRMVRPAVLSSADAAAAPPGSISAGVPAGGDGLTATTSAPVPAIPVGAGSVAAGPVAAGSARPAGAASAWASGMQAGEESRPPGNPAPADPGSTGV